jgi:hypothetical protein
VKTIVLISPIRAAIRAAARAEDRLGQPERVVEPEREQALDDQAARERVEREQRRQPSDNAPRPVQSEPAGDRGVGRRHLDGARHRPDDRDEQEPEHRVADEDRPVGIEA